MVLFCVERRKAWRMMQSRAGVVNTDYPAQKAVRAALAEGEPVADRIAFAAARFAAELAGASA
jgi:pyruvate-ferredoxin/flavodoxin oxidoreductase